MSPKNGVHCRYLLGCVLVATSCWSPPAFARNVERVSLSGSGTEGNGLSRAATMSADGRFVVFSSGASNLILGDSNAHLDVLVRDCDAAVTERVSISSAGVEGNGDSDCWNRPAISEDGRFVAFTSAASNLVTGDSNGRWDVFVRDRQTGQTSRVSVSSAGAQANGDSFGGTLSGDGRFVEFRSFATNLVTGDTNGTGDTFVHDRQTGQTTRVSVSTAGQQANAESLYGCISADGRFVAFSSAASNLVAGDANGCEDVFVRDLQTGQTERVSLSNAGAEGTAASRVPAISGDGRFVAFQSLAGNLVADDTNGCDDIYVRDRQGGQTYRASVPTAGGEANAACATPSMSADGRFVGFESDASNLVASDANGKKDVFVRDRLAGETERISVAGSGGEADGPSDWCWVSADGACVAFESTATNLVSGDTNAVYDVFVVSDYGLACPRLSWTGTAGYEADGVNPDVGDPNSTTFAFRVKYTDPSGDPPVLARCLVQRKDCGGGWHGCATLTLTKESGDIATGATYSGTTLLPNVPLKYRFRFKAGDDAAVEGDPNTWRQGPMIDGVPSLCFTGNAGFETDGVDPDAGPRGTTFQFEVLYTDSAGDGPTSHQLVIRRNSAPWRTEEMTAASGGTYRLGKVYRKSLAIKQAGTYRYCFSFADPLGKALGPGAKWKSGPTITSGTALVTSVAAAPTPAGAQVTFSLTEAAEVTATVLNVAGRPVKVILSGRDMEAGLQTVLWDCKADSGLAVPAGMYLVRVTARNKAGGESSAIAVVRVR